MSPSAAKPQAPAPTAKLATHGARGPALTTEKTGGSELSRDIRKSSREAAVSMRRVVFVVDASAIDATISAPLEPQL